MDLNAIPDVLRSQLQQVGRTDQNALDNARRNLHPSEQQDNASEQEVWDAANSRIELSSIERDYTARIGMEVRQFGYSFTGSAIPTGSDLQDRNLLVNGAVPADYVLGIGDELIITLRGQVNRSTPVRVDREGRVLLEDMPPIPAAGRSFGDFEADLRARVASAYVGTDVFASIGSIRSISVIVGGEVRDPGLIRLTSFSSLMEALHRARGILPSGTLRNISIIRNGQRIRVDLYDLLINARPLGDVRLQDGDQIIVNTIGQTMAVTGDVVRGGVFELPPGTDEITLAEAMKIAGGPIRTVGNQVKAFRLDQAGRNRPLLLPDQNAAVKAGDILVVAQEPSALSTLGNVEIEGERSVASYPSLSTLLRSPDFLQSNPYLPLAVLISEDPVTRQTRKSAVDLNRVYRGEIDVQLHPRDTLVVFSHNDIRYLSSADVQAVLNGVTPTSVDVAAAEQRTRIQTIQANPSVSPDQVGRGNSTGLSEGTQRKPGAQRSGASLAQPSGLISIEDGMPIRTDFACEGLRALAEVNALSGGRFASSVVFQTMSRRRNAIALPDLSGERETTTLPGLASERELANVQPCPTIFDQHPDLLPFLLEYAVSVQGEARVPGVYPVTPGTDLNNLLQAAGGLSVSADLTNIELMDVKGQRRSGYAVDQTAAVTIGPGESVRVGARISERERGFVELAGEVALPGRYEIRRGERLSDLIQRAGGLTTQAYAYGAVFTRESVRLTEEEGFRRVAQEIEVGLPAMIATSGSTAASITAAMPFFQTLVQRLRTQPAVGRLVVEADPVVLAARPEADIILQAGDRLTVPKRPSHVTISGAVLNPGAVMFRSGQKATDYLKLAGGPSDQADRSNAFIIFPNGESQPLQLGAWFERSVLIPPGSTIVVPQDVSPFSFLNTTRDIVSIVSDIALAAASLAVINNN
ncbi:SLBB domain-containing protein [Indioceanicola profundi]|uniref:SLBB domain-containing protein n=1 Tax=Indioceanicola profundi TaxID=2220096 RepID=UPI0013C3EFC6|nr:SLBB domain-containing protein [Indioceanicola profundi]